MYVRWWWGWSVFVVVAVWSGAAERHELVRGDLRVVIETDTTRMEERYGPRYDRTAQVVSVRRGEREFLAPDGLVDEFAQEGLGLVGFGPGKVFLKPGVGLLRENSERGSGYRFTRFYPVVAAGRVDVTVEEFTLEARHTMPEIEGVQVVLHKRYELHETGELRLTFTLSQTGGALYRCDHYNHHYFTWGGAEKHADHRVRFTGVPSHWPVRTGPYEAVGEGWRLGAPLPPRRTAYMAITPPAEVGVAGPSPEEAREEAGFTMSDGTGARVDFAAGAPATRFAIWAGDEGFCPEIFVALDVPSGGEARWVQRYRFGAE